ncbi:MAG TPA: zf-HC2 domain-containing protein [Pyrinomonadaceae bacterium]|nr:zf-HC2 domain-containing protein [Pyrinomonadaceae bacterium]
MNCEHCQNLLSEFVDDRTGCTMSAEIEAHLELCHDCAGIHGDFAYLTGFCSDFQEQEIAPPNSQALWCRISNIIESEIQDASAPPAEEKKKQGFWGRAWEKRWQLSFSQAVTAVIGVAVVSSLLTIVGIRNAVRSSNNLTANAAMQPTLFENLLSKAGLTPAPEELREKSLNEKQAVIDYWNARVGERRTRWNQRMRDTFDRNLHEIDQVVMEYSRNLKENPADSLSEEMLNSALTEKMDLLREFSEL